eukprot:2103289-Pleurochrysis_carterae.AAC.1
MALEAEARAIKSQRKACGIGDLVQKRQPVSASAVDASPVGTRHLDTRFCTRTPCLMVRASCFGVRARCSLRVMVEMSYHILGAGERQLWYGAGMQTNSTKSLWSSGRTGRIACSEISASRIPRSRLPFAIHLAAPLALPRSCKRVRRMSDAACLSDAPSPPTFASETVKSG